MNSIKQSKWIYALLSVLIAVAIWMYARAGEDPQMENRVKGISVVTEGNRVLENQSLMVDSVSHETVTLNWKGSWRDIGQLNKENVTVSVDVSRITEPGTYELDYDIQYPPSVPFSAISLQSGNPAKVSVTVSEIYSETFEVQPLLKGSVADGYQAGDFILEPETVMISGARQKVSSIDRVQVVLEAKDMKESFSGELALRLLDEKGQQIDPTGLRFSTENVYTVLPVVVVKEIPLSVNFIDGGGATQKDISFSIEPKTITVSGAKEDMQYLNELSLGSIDLSQVMDTVTEEFPIYLPAELENVSGTTSAKVTVSINGLTTKAFEVSDIELTNVPKGYTASLTTRVRTVVLRGTRKDINKVTASQIRIIADLSELSTATGSYNVPVKVYLYTDGNVGVIGQNNIVINLTKK